MTILFCSAELHNPDEVKIARYYALNPPISWAVLPELPSRLSKFGFKLKSSSFEGHWFPDNIECDSLEEAAALVRTRGEPTKYTIWVRCIEVGETKQLLRDISVHIHRITDNFDQKYHVVEITGTTDSVLLEAVTSFLGLKDFPEDDELPRPALGRSVFIAHRFDETGSLCADKVARFFDLLGFSVKSGRGFSPTSVAEKVKQRIQSQAIVIVLLTPGDDSTWLIQESVFGGANKKPVIVLRDRATDYKPALFGDQEYIPFTPSAIEAAFIPLLEGLLELGYAPRLGDEDEGE
jgi:hypothetical protein